MISLRILQLSAAATLVFACQNSFAQLGQLGGGGNNAGVESATAAGVGGASVGTTEGISGATTQGIPGGDADAGTAGNNIAEEFVGGGADAFVGGGIETQRNNARQFRAITPTDVPTGGSGPGTGTPRRVPVSLRIGFTYPRPDAASLLIGAAGPPIQQMALSRPEFRNVQVTVTAAGVATLTGSTPDAASRRLAANVIRLRPGIRKIDNKLMVAVQLLP